MDEVARLTAELASAIERVCYNDTVSDLEGITEDPERALEILEAGFWGCARFVLADVIRRLENAIAENEAVRRLEFEKALRKHFLQMVRSVG